MLTVTLFTGLVAGLATVYLWRRDYKAIAFGALLACMLVLSCASAGPFLTEAGKSLGEVANLLTKVGQLLPR